MSLKFGIATHCSYPVHEYIEKAQHIESYGFNKEVLPHFRA